MPESKRSIGIVFMSEQARQGALALAMQHPDAVLNFAAPRGLYPEDWDQGLTPSPEQASAFAESAQYGKGDGPNVMPLFLSLKNLAMVLDGVMPNGMRLSQAQGRGIPGSALDARWVAEVRRQKEIPGHLHAIGRAPIARYGASEQAGNARDFRPSPETMKPP